LHHILGSNAPREEGCAGQDFGAFGVVVASPRGGWVFVNAGIELYWIPVAAGTARLQRASLRVWETFEAARARRPRATLFHTALKLWPTGGEALTLELAPAFKGGTRPPLASGPVGVRWADRWVLFRYELVLVPAPTLPDEQWAVDSPVRLTAEAATAARIIEIAPTVPGHTWGRRVTGTQEMWTSDSVVSWLLVRAGLDLSRVQPPAGGRAPGWDAGIDVASTRR
jgi:hypothetical protein